MGGKIFQRKYKYVILGFLVVPYLDIILHSWLLKLLKLPKFHENSKKFAALFLNVCSLTDQY